MATHSTDEAPGRLDLLRLLVNTWDFPSGPDRLGTIPEAAQWCSEHALPPPANQTELERLRGFREALRAAMLANNGEGDSRAAWGTLAPHAERARLAVAIDPVRGPILEADCPECEDRAIARMLVILYDSVADGTWPRMRACRKRSCQFAYYDHSKNASRAWCSMAVCGNREKAQRRRSRDRAL